MAAPRSRETKGPMAALRGQGAGKLSRYPTAPGGPNPGRGTGQAGSTAKHCHCAPASSLRFDTLGKASPAQLLPAIFLRPLSLTTHQTIHAMFISGAARAYLCLLLQRSYTEFRQKLTRIGIHAGGFGRNRWQDLGGQLSDRCSGTMLLWLHALFFA